MNTSLTYEPDWEYRDFIYQQWSPDHVWSCVGGDDQHTASYARFALWETLQMGIMKELDNWRCEGWEPVDEIGPRALKIHRTETEETSFNPADVALWLLTAGAALLVQLFLGEPVRTYSMYRPLEFRIRVRRPKRAAFAQAPELSIA